MAGEWRQCALGDVVELKRGHDLPQQHRRPGAVPLVSSSGVTDHHAEANARGPGVVTGRYGTLGQVFYIEEDFWPLNTTLYVHDFKGNSPRFISYFLRGLDFLAYSDKAAVPGLNRNHLHQAQVVIPVEVTEQRAIAHILGTLDDKIELNQRMSQTLDSMAVAMFQSWFVDFEPVRARAGGLASKLPRHLTDLFPTKLLESDVGEVPAGWTLTTLYETAEYINGAAYSAFEPNAEGLGLPIVKIAELKAGITSQTRFSQVRMPAKYRIKRGDILFSWSGNPDTSIGTFVWTGDEAWLNQHVFRVVPRSDHERSFILLLLRFLRPVLAEAARNRQTTGLGHVTAGDMKRLPIVRPDDAVLRAWDAMVGPILDRSHLAARESLHVRALRDALLPKLISGELRVRDAEKLVGAAT